MSGDAGAPARCTSHAPHFPPVRERASAPLQLSHAKPRKTNMRRKRAQNGGGIYARTKASLLFLHYLLLLLECRYAILQALIHRSRVYRRRVRFLLGLAVRGGAI